MNFLHNSVEIAVFIVVRFLLAHSVYVSVVNMFSNYDAFIDMTMCGHFYVIKTK